MNLGGSERTELAELTPSLGAGWPGPRNGCAELRQKLWSAFLVALNHSKLPYCLLGAPESTEAAANSDVDFVVRPCDYPLVPQLLASAAASVGGHLVQSIEHETTATYFALAVQQHGRVAFLHPDCTTDYRRQGRLWLSSQELLGGRRQVSGGHYRPAPDIDFKYYLTKQVLKQAISDLQWKKLLALREAADNPGEALSWWPLATAAQIEQALLSNDREQFRTLLPNLRRELLNTPAAENAPAKACALAHDATRVVRRLTHPTGLFVHITTGGLQQRTALAGNLASRLAPAFRCASVAVSINPTAVLRDLAASTLLISPFAAGPLRALYRGLAIQWQPELAGSGNFEFAASAILAHLSRRTVRRLKLQPIPAQTRNPHTLTHTSAP